LWFDEGGGIGAGVDVLWCFLWSFCVIFKFIFGGFWIIIMEKDGWPYWLIDIWSYGDFFEWLERRSLEVCR
jgi:hypothetical protein